MSALRTRIETAAEAGGLSLGRLTVLATQNDPYRYDTPAGHRVAAWFAEVFAAHVSPRAVSIHLRGLHYRLLGLPKLDGKPYSNTETDWLWLSKASQIARWLDYVPFDRIHDQRNDAPEVLVVEAVTAAGSGSIGIVGGYIELPYLSLDGVILPEARASAPTTRQPFRIVVCAEKSSVRDELLPIVQRVGGELVLPTGEMSDTLINGIAGRAATDGRPTVVLYATDFDPAGNQMPRSVARKLQALRDLRYPDLRIEVRRVALTVGQCETFELPSTPLKETERRADGWRRYTGREQTELDALLALHPGALRGIFEQAVNPFYDSTLVRRSEEARRTWETAANERLIASGGYAAAVELLEAARVEANKDLAAATAAIEQARARMADAMDEADRLLPAIDEEIPAVPPILTATADAPLYTTDDDYTVATLKLVADKPGAAPP